MLFESGASLELVPEVLVVDFVVELNFGGLHDRTEEAGATRFVPESHKLGPWRELSQSDTLGAVMPRGSVMILSGRLYHGSGENRSRNVRRGMTIDFIAAWLRQMENQYLSCPPEIARTLDPALLRLMGYQVTPHSVGRVGDWLDPLSVVLGGEDRLNEGALGAM